MTIDYIQMQAINLGLNIETQLILFYTDPLTHPHKQRYTQKHLHRETSHFIPLPLPHPTSAHVFCNGGNYCLNGGVQQWRK